MPGGPTAGGDRDLRPAGPRAEVHQLGYDSPLQGSGALQQGSGTASLALTLVRFSVAVTAAKLILHWRPFLWILQITGDKV